MTEDEPKEVWHSPRNLTRIGMAALTGMAVGAALPVTALTLPLVGAVSMATIGAGIFGLGAHFGIRKSELE